MAFKATCPASCATRGGGTLRGGTGGSRRKALCPGTYGDASFLPTEHPPHEGPESQAQSCSSEAPSLTGTDTQTMFTRVTAKGTGEGDTTGNCRSPEEGAPEPRVPDSQSYALSFSAQLLPSASGDPRHLLVESLPGQRLITAPSE